MQTGAGSRSVAFIAGLAHPLSHLYLLPSHQYLSTLRQHLAHTVKFRTRLNPYKSHSKASLSKSTMSHSNTNNQAHANDAAGQSPSQAVSTSPKR